MAKMDWDRVAREDRLRRFIAGPAAGSDGKGSGTRGSTSSRKAEPIRVRAGDTCTCCGRPFRVDDPYKFTNKETPERPSEPQSECSASQAEAGRSSDHQQRPPVRSEGSTGKLSDHCDTESEQK